jgi:hypothetical protein
MVKYPPCWMRRLLLLMRTLGAVSPALGADWAFYGSQRQATWYVDRHYGDSTLNGLRSDRSLQWYFQWDSRVGARVRSDAASGLIELGLTAGPGTSGGSGGDGNVTTRRAYVVWKISEATSIKVGKDYSPVSDPISNQMFDSDDRTGNFYGKRPAGVTLIVGKLQVALLTPSYGSDPGTSATGVNGAVGGDPDSYIPRLEATYEYRFGSGYVRPFGGFQWYQVQPTGTPGSNVTGELNVLSWALGLSTRWEIGDYWIGAQASCGMNEGAITAWDPGSNTRASSQPYLRSGNDLADVHSLQLLAAPGVKLNDTLSLEAGVSYRLNDAHGALGYSRKDASWVGYLQAILTMTPGVYICPELGYYDYLEDRSGPQ